MARLLTGTAGRQVTRFHARERRRAAQDLKEFDALRDSPQNLGTVAAGGDSASSVTLPANARLAVSLDDVTDENDLSLKNNDDPQDQVFGGGGPADFVQKLSRFREAQEITVHRDTDCPSGSFTMYVLDEWERPFAIATATFT